MRQTRYFYCRVIGSLAFALGILFSTSASADVLIDFDGLSANHEFPSKFVSPTSPAFDIDLIVDTNQVNQLDNAHFGGSNYSLRFSGTGSLGTISFKLSNDATFDFSSFDYVARAVGGLSVLEVLGVQADQVVGQFSFGNQGVGTKDLTAVQGFQDIDELRISAFGNPNQYVFDNFRFNNVAVPEPNSFLIMLCTILLAAVRRRRVLSPSFSN